MTDVAIQRAPTAISAKTPMDLLQLAIEREGSIDVIERLAKLQMEFTDRDDKIAFRNAMTRFKEDMPKIIRTRPIVDKQGAEKYKVVALEDVADPVMKALVKLGITYRYKSSDLPDGRIRVTCILGLQGTAYEEEGATLAAPPDTAGGKDPLKAVGSTTSYLEKYTLLASVGMHVYGSDPELVPPEQNEQHMDQGAAADFQSLIEGSANVDDLQRNYFAARDAAKAAGDTQAEKGFAEAKNKVYRKLAKGAVHA
jgi:hypothetical protein